MRKVTIIIIASICFVLLAGCDLFPWDPGTQYFYSMAGEDNQPSEYTLNARSEGYTIVMSRGVENQILTEQQATALISTTEFVLQLDGENLGTIGTKTAKLLGDNSGYHVVQEYHLPPLEEGTYLLFGKTIFHDLGDGAQRQNEVTLTIE